MVRRAIQEDAKGNAGVAGNISCAGSEKFFPFLIVSDAHTDVIFSFGHPFII
jgi:hypothetical protein